MPWGTHFVWEGSTGAIEVECIPNDDPDAYGTFAADAHGFPVCTATVSYPRRGYGSMFGWVQLVRSTDNTSHGEQFEPDPFALFGDAHSPYCWYGIEPTLFDAPSRIERAPLDWLAYSFLATIPLKPILSGNPRSVVPITGFAWGFDVHDDGTVSLREVSPIASADWELVVPILRAEYPSPSWTFADTF